MCLEIYNVQKHSGFDFEKINKGKYVQTFHIFSLINTGVTSQQGKNISFRHNVQTGCGC
jgi:hypothetical protein